MLALLALCSVQMHFISERVYDENVDRKSIPRTTVYGIVQNVSLSGITIQTTEKLPAIKSYPTHRRLSQGMYSYRAHDPIAYTIHDIKVGDSVSVYLCQEGKTDFCFALSIDRRPGGTIPESRNPRIYRSYAEVTNALIALKETGKAIPRFVEPGKECEYPYADPQIGKNVRLKRWPAQSPFTYIEFVIFMR